MKRLIATTALSQILSTSAFADAHSAKLNTYQMEQTGDIYASNFIGMRVYGAEKAFDALTPSTKISDGGEKEWEDIGEVNDVILGRNGSVKAVVLGVGGFVGIGEKNVAVAMSDLKIVQDRDEKDDFFLVIKANKQNLTDAAEFKKSAAVEATTTEPVADGDRPMLMTPRVERDGYSTAKTQELTTEDLTGARVYSRDNEDVGEIDRLLVGTDGKIKHAIIDVGGFLSLGERTISVTMNELTILRKDDDSDVQIFIDGTRSELEKQPVYEG